MAKPFLGVLEEMATAAGVAFVSVAKPFTAPLKKGLDLLMGCSDLHLEVGLKTTLDKPILGDFVVIGAKRDGMKLDQLTVAPDFKLVDAGGKAIQDYPYFIFSIEVSESGRIGSPSLKLQMYTTSYRMLYGRVNGRMLRNSSTYSSERH